MCHFTLIMQKNLFNHKRQTALEIFPTKYFNKPKNDCTFEKQFTSLTIFKHYDE